MNEVSLASKKMNPFEVHVNVLVSPDAQGGHLESRGLSPTGAVIDVPLHRHHVTLSTSRIDVRLQYSLNAQWGLQLNTPYSVKAQEASIEWLPEHPVSAEEEQAILRSRDNHHRTETYSGFSDATLLLSRKQRSVFKRNDLLLARFGTTLPIGKTEENPWHLGDLGIEHLHIQFGTGTFNPIANLQYNLPLRRDTNLSVTARGTFPFYENSKTYQGPIELTYTAGFSYRPLDWLSLNGNYLGFYQTAAVWAGERDINTGLRYSMAAFGLSFAIPNDMSISANVMFPLTQATLYDDSDAIEFGNLVSVNTSYSF